MSEIADRPTKETKVTTVQGFDLHTLTPAGASYVEKKIHPPAPTPADYRGRPSTTSQEIVLFQTPGETDVRPSFVYNSGTSVAPAYKYIYPESMLFLTMPGGVVASYNFMKISDNTYAQQNRLNLELGIQTQSPACLNTGYDWAGNYSKDVAEHYVDYKSTTFYANCTDFNNQGLISTSTFKPDVILSTISTIAASLDQKSRNNLYAALGVPSKKKSSRKNEDYNEDFEVIDEVSMPYANSKFQFLNFGTQEATIGTLGGQVTITGLFPKDIGEIQVMSRNNATRPFKEGAFVVARDSEEVQMFMPRPVLTDTSEGNNLVGSMLTWYNPTLNQTLYVWLNTYPVGSGTELPFKSQDIPWSMTTASLTLVQGMSVPSNQTTPVALSSLPFISVKTITGFAVQPAPRSSLNVFINELPVPDRAALDMIACINRSRPDSLPAASNDFGTIATAIISLAPTVISLIKDLFGSKKAPAPVVEAPKPVIAKKTKPKNKPQKNFKPPTIVRQMRRVHISSRKPSVRIPTMTFTKRK